jgi:hypothetical protein
MEAAIGHLAVHAGMHASTAIVAALGGPLVVFPVLDTVCLVAALIDDDDDKNDNGDKGNKKS